MEEDKTSEDGLSGPSSHMRDHEAAVDTSAMHVGPVAASVDEPLANAEPEVAAGLPAVDQPVAITALQPEHTVDTAAADFVDAVDDDNDDFGDFDSAPPAQLTPAPEAAQQTSAAADDDDFGDFNTEPSAAAPAAVVQPTQPSLAAAESADLLSLQGDEFKAEVSKRWEIALGSKTTPGINHLQQPDTTLLATAQRAQQVRVAAQEGSVLGYGGVPLPTASPHPSSSHAGGQDAASDAYKPTVTCNYPLSWRGSASEARLLQSLGLQEAAALAALAEAAAASQPPGKKYGSATAILPYTHLVTNARVGLADQNSRSRVGSEGGVQGSIELAKQKHLVRLLVQQTAEQSTAGMQTRGKQVLQADSNRIRYGHVNPLAMAANWVAVHSCHSNDQQQQQSDEQAVSQETCDNGMTSEQQDTQLVLQGSRHCRSYADWTQRLQACKHTLQPCTLQQQGTHDNGPCLLGDEVECWPAVQPALIAEGQLPHAPAGQHSSVQQHEQSQELEEWFLETEHCVAVVPPNADFQASLQGTEPPLTAEATLPDAPPNTATSSVPAQQTSVVVTLVPTQPSPLLATPPPALLAHSSSSVIPTVSCSDPCAAQPGSMEHEHVPDKSSASECSSTGGCVAGLEGGLAHSACIAPGHEDLLLDCATNNSCRTTSHAPGAGCRQLMQLYSKDSAASGASGTDVYEATLPLLHADMTPSLELWSQETASAVADAPAACSTVSLLLSESNNSSSSSSDSSSSRGGGGSSSRGGGGSNDVCGSMQDGVSSVHITDDHAAHGDMQRCTDVIHAVQAVSSVPVVASGSTGHNSSSSSMSCSAQHSASMSSTVAIVVGPLSVADPLACSESSVDMPQDMCSSPSTLQAAALETASTLEPVSSSQSTLSGTSINGYLQDAITHVGHDSSIEPDTFDSTGAATDSTPAPAAAAADSIPSEHGGPQLEICMSPSLWGKFTVRAAADARALEPVVAAHRQSSGNSGSNEHVFEQQPPMVVLPALSRPTETSVKLWSSVLSCSDASSAVVTQQTNLETVMPVQGLCSSEDNLENSSSSSGSGSSSSSNDAAGNATGQQPLHDAERSVLNMVAAPAAAASCEGASKACRAYSDCSEVFLTPVGSTASSLYFTPVDSGHNIEAQQPDSPHQFQLRRGQEDPQPLSPRLVWPPSSQPQLLSPQPPPQPQLQQQQLSQRLQRPPAQQAACVQQTSLGSRSSVQGGASGALRSMHAALQQVTATAKLEAAVVAAVAMMDHLTAEADDEAWEQAADALVGSLEQGTDMLQDTHQNDVPGCHESDVAIASETAATVVDPGCVASSATKPQHGSALAAGRTSSSNRMQSAEQSVEGAHAARSMVLQLQAVAGASQSKQLVALKGGCSAAALKQPATNHEHLQLVQVQLHVERQMVASPPHNHRHTEHEHSNSEQVQQLVSLQLLVDRRNGLVCCGIVLASKGATDCQAAAHSTLSEPEQLVRLHVWLDDCDMDTGQAQQVRCAIHVLAASRLDRGHKGVNHASYAADLPATCEDIVRVRLNVLPEAGVVSIPALYDSTPAVSVEDSPAGAGVPMTPQKPQPACVDDVFGDLFTAQDQVSDAVQKDPLSALENAFSARLVHVLRSLRPAPPARSPEPAALEIDPFEGVLDYEQAALVAAKAIEVMTATNDSMALQVEQLDADKAQALADALQRGLFQDLLQELQQRLGIGIHAHNPKPKSMVVEHEEDVIRRHWDWVAQCEAMTAAAAAAKERQRQEAAAAVEEAASRRVVLDVVNALFGSVLLSAATNWQDSSTLLTPMTSTTAVAATADRPVESQAAPVAAKESSNSSIHQCQVGITSTSTQAHHLQQQQQQQQGSSRQADYCDATPFAASWPNQPRMRVSASCGAIAGLNAPHAPATGHVSPMLSASGSAGASSAQNAATQRSSGEIQPADQEDTIHNSNDQFKMLRSRVQSDEQAGPTQTCGSPQWQGRLHQAPMLQQVASVIPVVGSPVRAVPPRLYDPTLAPPSSEQHQQLQQRLFEFLQQYPEMDAYQLKYGGENARKVFEQSTVWARFKVPRPTPQAYRDEGVAMPDLSDWPSDKGNWPSYEGDWPSTAMQLTASIQATSTAATASDDDPLPLPPANAAACEVPPSKDTAVLVRLSDDGSEMVAHATNSPSVQASSPEAVANTISTGLGCADDPAGQSAGDHTQINLDAAPSLRHFVCESNILAAWQACGQDSNSDISKERAAATLPDHARPAKLDFHPMRSSAAQDSLVDLLDGMTSQPTHTSQQRQPPALTACQQQALQQLLGNDAASLTLIDLRGMLPQRHKHGVPMADSPKQPSPSTKLFGKAWQRSSQPALALDVEADTDAAASEPTGHGSAAITPACAVADTLLDLQPAVSLAMATALQGMQDQPSTAVKEQVSPQKRALLQELQRPASPAVAAIRTSPDVWLKEYKATGSEGGGLMHAAGHLRQPSVSISVPASPLSSVGVVDPEHLDKDTAVFKELDPLLPAEDAGTDGSMHSTAPMPCSPVKGARHSKAPSPMRPQSASKLLIHHWSRPTVAPPTAPLLFGLQPVSSGLYTSQQIMAAHHQDTVLTHMAYDQVMVHPTMVMPQYQAQLASVHSSPALHAAHMLGAAPSSPAGAPAMSAGMVLAGSLSWQQQGLSVSIPGSAHSAPAAARRQRPASTTSSPKSTSQ